MAVLIERPYVCACSNFNFDQIKTLRTTISDKAAWSQKCSGGRSRRTKNANTPWRLGTVVIASDSRTEDPVFESRERFIGIYTLQCWLKKLSMQCHCAYLRKINASRKFEEKRKLKSVQKDLPANGGRVAAFLWLFTTQWPAPAQPRGLGQINCLLWRLHLRILSPFCLSPESLLLIYDFIFHTTGKNEQKFVPGPFSTKGMHFYTK
jgi:hypothetical protein